VLKLPLVPVQARAAGPPLAEERGAFPSPLSQPGPPAMPRNTGMQVPVCHWGCQCPGPSWPGFCYCQPEVAAPARLLGKHFFFTILS
jgi:hypothetical protein